MIIKNTLILLESDRSNADTLVNTLYNYGYSVSHSESKSELISLVQKGKYDLVLIPVSAGEELKAAETAGLLYDNYRIPSVFIVSLNGKMLLENSLQSPVMGYVTDPPAIKELIHVVELTIYRHAMNLKLYEAEKKYYELFNTTVQTIVECDLEGRIINLNTHGLTMFGLKERDLNKKLFLSDFIQPNNSGTFMEVCKNRLYNPMSRCNVEFDLISRSGKKYYIEEQLTLVYKNRVPYGYRGILLDITSKKVKQQLSKTFHSLCRFFDRSDADSTEISQHLISRLKEIFSLPEIYYVDGVNGPATDKQTKSDPAFKAYANYCGQKGETLFLNAFTEEAFYVENKLPLLMNPKTCWMGFPLNFKPGGGGVMVFVSENNSIAFSKREFKKLAEFFERVNLFLEKLNYLKELKRSENLFKSLVNTINEGLITVDMNQRITFANARLEELSGYKHEEVVGNNCNLFLDAKEQEALVTILENRIKGISERYEMPIKMKSGDYKKFLINGAPLRDENGSVIGAISTFTDLSAKIDKGSVTSAADSFLQEISNKIEVAQWVYSVKEQQILYLSPAFESLFEVELEEIYRSNSLFKYMHPLDRRTIRKPNIKHYSKGISEMAYRIVTPSGKVKWIQDKSILIKDESGKVEKIVGYAQDITKLKEAEEKFQKSESEKNSIITALPGSFMILKNGDEIENTFFKESELDFLPVKEKRMRGNRISKIFDDRTAEKILSKAVQCHKRPEPLVFELSRDVRDERQTYEIKMNAIDEEKVLMVVRGVISMRV